MPKATETISLSIPRLNGNEWLYLKECLDTNWVSSAGPFVDRFEEEVARYTGARHAVAVMNGTAALHVALRVAGVEPGDEVLVPALTFIAPVNAIRYCGAEPVFMDVRRDTWQMDMEKTAEFLQERCEHREGAQVNRETGARVAAILPVHVMGLAAGMERLMELADSHGLPVVEDAAEAMGVRYEGQHVGTFGVAGCLSFNGNKIITSGGGGMVLTASDDVADDVRYLTTQAKDDPLEYVHEEVGYNYRLTNIQAALGIAQLEQLDSFVARKQEIAMRYQVALQDIPGLTPMPAPKRVDPTYWLYTVLIHAEEFGTDSRGLISHLRERGIEARPFWRPAHLQRPYRGCSAYRVEVAKELYRSGVSLPSSTGLTPAQQNRVIAAVRDSPGS